MNKRKILFIGCGKAGNKIVDEILKRDKRLTGLFVNTAYKDMAGLENFSEERAFLFSGADGSGRNREVAKNYVKDQIKSLADVITGYPLHDVIYIVTSADGGTGSGMTPMLCQMLDLTFKSKKSDKKINLITVMPSLKIDDKIGFENSLSFWNDLVEDKKNKSGEVIPNSSVLKACVNNVLVIDNSKCDTFKEINERAVNGILTSLNLNGEHDEGDIDDRDAKVLNTENGFGLILELSPNPGYGTQYAIDEAIKESVFAIPNSYDCNYIGISLKEDDFMIADVRNCFENVCKATFKTYNNKTNTIVLSGCNEPSELIENIKKSLDEINERQSNRTVEVRSVNMNLSEVTNKAQTKQPKAVVFTEDELDDLAEALENLFD